MCIVVYPAATEPSAAIGSFAENALQGKANTLQRTATLCNVLQHTAAHCYTQSFAEKVLQGNANTLQRTATQSNILQHTASH